MCLRWLDKRISDVENAALFPLMFNLPYYIPNSFSSDYRLKTQRKLTVRYSFFSSEHIPFKLDLTGRPKITLFELGLILILGQSAII